MSNLSEDDRWSRGCMLWVFIWLATLGAAFYAGLRVAGTCH